MSKTTRRGVIPNIPTNVDPNMRQFLEAVRESMQVTLGQRGNRLDSAVTFRDLEGKFGVTMQAINSLRQEIGRPAPVNGVLDAPTGLGVAYAFDTALVYWDFPYMSGYAYSEVFRVGIEALNGVMPSTPAFSEDYLIATVNGSRITDNIAPDFAYFYWVRHVGTNGVVSAIAGPVFALGSDLPSTIVDRVFNEILTDEFILELQDRIGVVDLSALFEADALLQSGLANINQALSNADQRLTAADQALQTQIGNVNSALQSADQRLTAADQALDEAINDAKELLESQIASQGSTILALQNTTATQATSLNNLTTRVGTAESSITSLNTTTSGHASRLTSIESVNTTQGTNISSLQTTTASHATSISRLGAFNTTANKYAFIVSLEEVDATQASQISGLTTRMTGAESSITTLNNTTATQATSLNNLTTRVGTAESSISSLNTTTGDHASRLTSIESVNTTQGTNISSLQTTTASHATSISRLGAFNTTANKYAFIVSLEEVDATQASQISGLTTRMTGAESSITTLNNTTATQATSLNSLTTRVGTAESSISSLNTTTSGHTTSINNLNTRMGSAESSITTLNNTTSSQATSLTNLTTRMGTAESGISSLNTTTSSQATSISNLTTRMGTAESGITTLNNTTASQAVSINQAFFSAGDVRRYDRVELFSTIAEGENAAVIPASTTWVTQVTGGGVIVDGHPTNTTNRYIYTARAYPVDPNRRYRISVFATVIQDRTVVAGESNPLVEMAVYGFNENFAYPDGTRRRRTPTTTAVSSANSFSQRLTSANGRVRFEAVFTGENASTTANRTDFFAGTRFIKIDLRLLNAPGARVLFEALEIRDITEVVAVENSSRAYVDTQTGQLRAQQVLKVDANGVVAAMSLDATAGGDSRLNFVASQMNFVNTPGGAPVAALSIRDGRLVFRDAIAENIDVENLRAVNAVAINFAAAGSVQLPAGVIRPDNLDTQFLRRLVMIDPDAETTGGSATVIRDIRFMGTNAERGYGTFVSTTILGGNNNTEVNLKFNGYRFASGRSPSGSTPWFTAPKVQFRIRRGATLITIPAETITLVNAAAGSDGATIAHLGSNLYEVTGRVLSNNENEPNGQVLWSRETWITFNATFNIGRFTNESAYSIEIVQTSGGIPELQVTGSYNIFEPVGSTGGLVVNTSWEAIANKPQTATRWPTLAEIGAQSALGFTPIEQGGGTLQGSNKIRFGWGTDGSQLRLQVDSTDFGNSFPISISKNAATATALQTARSINGTSFNGSANITTANWGTARTLTVGNTGKSVNGSGNVSWSLSEIGAVSRSGDTMTGALTLPGISSNNPNSGSYDARWLDNWFRFRFGGTETPQGLSISNYDTTTITLNRNGTVTASTFVGALNGNANTATTLQTARTINGTSFNGSANITTANWGTARTLTIGNTGKSVNGSGNVSWSLAEIGAMEALHYDAIVRAGTWSRIARTNVTQLGGTYILALNHTRGNVVVNAVFLIASNHFNSKQIVQLMSGNYTQIQVRLTDVNADDAFVEILDNASGSGDYVYSVRLSSLGAGRASPITSYQAGGGTVRAIISSEFGGYKGQIVAEGQSRFNGTVVLNDNTLNLRQATDANHFLRWTSAIDGPELIGWLGGRLGSSGTGNIALRWAENGYCYFGSWAQHPNGTGLFWTDGTHFYSAGDGKIVLRGNHTASWLRMETNGGSTQGYIYTEAANIGFLNSNGTWSLRVDNSSFVYASRFYAQSSIRYKDIEYRASAQDSISRVKAIGRLGVAVGRYKDREQHKLNRWVIAEEVADITAEAVALDDSGRPDSVDYDQLIPDLYAALANALERIERLEGRV